jgi:hypothetical protein
MSTSIGPENGIKGLFAVPVTQTVLNVQFPDVSNFRMTANWVLVGLGQKF